MIENRFGNNEFKIRTFKKSYNFCYIYIYITYTTIYYLLKEYS